MEGRIRPCAVWRCLPAQSLHFRRLQLLLRVESDAISASVCRWRVCSSCLLVLVCLGRLLRVSVGRESECLAVFESLCASQ